MNPLLLIGCGGHARSLLELIDSSSKWCVHGLVGLPHQVNSSVLGYPVIGTDSDLPLLVKECPLAVLAIGQLPDPAPRQNLAACLQHLGFQFPVLISQYSTVSRYSQIGPGTTVGHGAIINAGASIGCHCIINSAALVEHDVQIGDYCHISTGALVNGGVTIGSGSFIGSGVLLREGLDLPPSIVVGAGKRVMGWPLRDQ